MAKHFMKFSTFASNVTVNTAMQSVLQSVHTTRRLVIMYRQVKFGRKRISSSENMVKLYFDYMIPYCDLDLESIKLYFCVTLQLI